MTALPTDYDSDPERFMSNAKWPHDDVHPSVAVRFAQHGARLVLDIGGGHGNLTRLLPDLGLTGVLLDQSATMLALAPRPAIRADGARLPMADASFDAVAHLYTLYHYDDPVPAIAESRRVLRPGGLFCACAPDRDNDPELAHLLPNWGEPSTFDGEEAGDIVAAVFDRPGDVVAVEPWDAPMVTLTTTEQVAAFLRSQGLMSDQAATDAARTVDLPLVMTKRGCFVYATRG